MLTITDSNTNINNFELLTVEEFAERMKISRSQVYNWIKTGFLKPGQHFIRRGRTIRFPWTSTLLERLMEDSDQEAKTRDPIQAPKKPTPRGGSTPAINLNY